MKIGLIGFGYWGNIILNNLKRLGYNEIIICEKNFLDKSFNDFPVISDYKKLKADCVFITSPTETHYNITKFFLNNNIDVFCEKPLTTNAVKAEELYDLAIKNNVKLFTDWIFTFNSHIETIKKDYESGKLGKIISITMNRLNLGPERFDVNARWDLASHDVSIIQYVFSNLPESINWNDYRRNFDSKQEDSSLGLLKFKDYSAIINVSWYYRKKLRECIFEFENYFVVWDDYKRFLQYEDASQIEFPIYSGNLSYPCSSYEESLLKSIKTFFSFSNKNMMDQKDLTINTLKILEGG